MGYFYFAVEVVIFVTVFLIVRENARLTLEQVDEFFQRSGKAWHTSLAKNKVIAKQETFQSIDT